MGEHAGATARAMPALRGGENASEETINDPTLTGDELKDLWNDV
jgi:hypothetical protein